MRQLSNLFIGSPRICIFLLLIVWVRFFSNTLPSVKFAEDKVLLLILTLIYRAEQTDRINRSRIVERTERQTVVK